MRLHACRPPESVNTEQREAGCLIFKSINLNTRHRNNKNKYTNYFIFMCNHCKSRFINLFIWSTVLPPATTEHIWGFENEDNYRDAYQREKQGSTFRGQKRYSLAYLWPPKSTSCTNFFNIHGMYFTVVCLHKICSSTSELCVCVCRVCTVNV